jgi:hypothetical protein
LGSLQTLVTLWLDDNELEAFPTCVCQLENLKMLRLSGNAIKTVPSLISSMSRLETLVWFWLFLSLYIYVEFLFLFSAWYCPGN